MVTSITIRKAEHATVIPHPVTGLLPYRQICDSSFQAGRIPERFSGFRDSKVI